MKAAHVEAIIHDYLIDRTRAGNEASDDARDDSTEEMMMTVRRR